MAYENPRANWTDSQYEDYLDSTNIGSMASREYRNANIEQSFNQLKSQTPDAIKAQLANAQGSKTSELARNVDRYINWNNPANATGDKFQQQTQSAALAEREKAMLGLDVERFNFNKTYGRLGYKFEELPWAADFYSKLGATPGAGTTAQQTAGMDTVTGIRPGMPTNPMSNTSPQAEAQWAQQQNIKNNVGTPAQGQQQAVQSMMQSAVQQNNISFRDGLTDAQKQSITLLSQKPKEQWTDTDRENWNYATVSAAPGATAPAAPSAPSAPAATSAPATQNPYPPNTPDHEAWNAQQTNIAAGVGVQQPGATPGAPATQNAATGQTGASGAVPAVGQKDALSQTYDTLKAQMAQSPEEEQTQRLLDEITSRQANLKSGEYASSAEVANKPIAMPYITGQQAAIGRQYAALNLAESSKAVPLEAKLAALQAKRAAATEVSKLDLQREKDLRAEASTASKEAAEAAQFEKEFALKQATLNKPVELSAGTSLVDPVTGKVIRSQPTAKAQSGTSGSGSGSGSSSGIGGGTVSGKLSPQAQQVFDNPSLLSQYTPTERGKFLNQFAAAGLKFDAASMEKLNAGQREQIDAFDTLQREAGLVESILVGGLKTGLLDTTFAKSGQLLGKSTDFTTYDSSLSNMNSILLRARSGGAVTPQEYDRIKGFIPSAFDDEKTAATKVARFSEEMEAARQNYIKRATQTTSQIIGGSTSAPAASTGTTSSGVKYTIIP